jgi:hypothetical protein
MSLPSSLPVHGPLPSGQPDLPTLLTAIRYEAHANSTAIHRAHPTVRCDLRISAPGNSVIRFDGDCACRDFLVDMVTECHRHLAERPGEFRNPVGAIRIHMRLRAIPDWIRQRRTAMGAQARVDRIRTGCRARGLPDEFHRALLEYLVDEAGSMAPLDGQDQLIRRLAARCADEFGGLPEQYLSRAADGAAVVERHCRSGPRVNMGTADQPVYITWWERYIQLPLGRRPRRTVVPLPEESGAAEAHLSAAYDATLAQAQFGEFDERVIAVFEEAKRRWPDDPEAAVHWGINELVACCLLTERAAVAILADRSRLESAVRALSAMD